jgi:hypothetical protein
MSVAGTVADHGLQANIFVPLCELFHARVTPGNLKGVMSRAAPQAASAPKLRLEETINQPAGRCPWIGNPQF